MRAARLALAGLLIVASCGDDDDPEAGEVVAREEMDLGGLAAIRIVYTSVDVRGDESTVGALVVVPDGEAPPDGWPIVAYGHGTTGNADECAPSDNPDRVGVGRALVAIADAGFLAVATDYEGIGTEGPHPYLNGPSEARALADSVRAARSIVPDSGERWAAFGYSQGGHAALWAAQGGDELAPELELVGAAALAPASDARALVAVVGAPVLALVVSGWLASDPDADADADEMLTEDGRVAVEAAEVSCDVEVDDVALLTDPGFAGFGNYTAENIPGGQPATVPVLVAQGSADPLVQPEVTADVVARSCAIGSTVELRNYDGADHVTIVAGATPDALAWLADRFAGAPPVSTCAPTP